MIYDNRPVHRVADILPGHGLDPDPKSTCSCYQARWSLGEATDDRALGAVHWSRTRSMSGQHQVMNAVTMAPIPRSGAAPRT